MKIDGYSHELVQTGGVQPTTSHPTMQKSLYEVGLDLDTQFQNSLGFPALKPDAKVIMAIGYHGDLTIKQAMLASQMSYRGFYIMLDRLIASKLVEVSHDEKDRRVRRVRLRAGTLKP